MIEIGRYQQLKVVKEVSFGVYLETADDTVLLPLKFVPEGTRRGDVLRVFLYLDSEDRPVATTQTPLAVLGGIAPMEVVDLTAHGAFVNWGLDKDLFIPKKEQFRSMRIGETQVVHVRMDERTQRLIGSTKLASFFDDGVAHLVPGREVDLMVYGFNEVGAQVVVDGRHAGLVYLDELRERPAIGAEMRGYIERVRDDGKIDVKLRKTGRPAEIDAQETILRELARAPDGFLGLHDKSPPEEIARRLEMSKKIFKAAIGGLYRRELILLESDGIRLRPQ